MPGKLHRRVQEMKFAEILTSNSSGRRQAGRLLVFGSLFLQALTAYPPLFAESPAAKRPSGKEALKVLIGTGKCAACDLSGMNLSGKQLEGVDFNNSIQAER